MFSLQDVIINEPVGSKFDKTLAPSGRVWIQSKSFIDCRPSSLHGGLDEVRIED